MTVKQGDDDLLNVKEEVRRRSVAGSQGVSDESQANKLELIGKWVTLHAQSSCVSEPEI